MDIASKQQGIHKMAMDSTRNQEKTAEIPWTLNEGKRNRRKQWASYVMSLWEWMVENLAMGEKLKREKRVQGIGNCEEPWSVMFWKVATHGYS